MKRLFVGLFVLASLVVWVTAVGSQPPGGGDKKKGKKGGPPPFVLGKVLPPFAYGEIELTAEQQQQIADLEREVKKRLETILTPEQRKQLENARPRGPGGPPGGGKGPDGPGGRPGPDTPGRRPDMEQPQAAIPAGIQWFATWESGLREAQATDRPILLVSAAPHCAGVSGTW